MTQLLLFIEPPAPPNGPGRVGKAARGWLRRWAWARMCRYLRACGWPSVGMLHGIPCCEHGMWSKA